METTKPAATGNGETRLIASELRWRCDPDTLGFESTVEVAPLEQTIGQERGGSALEFGLLQEVDGYNIYVAGPSGSGRMSTVRTLVDQVAAARFVPSEWCYARNLADPYQPKAIRVRT
jgi:hypothetical protein